MLIKLHDAQHHSPLLIMVERISAVEETYFIDSVSDVKHYKGSKIIMNDCEYTSEGHKQKIYYFVKETISEIQQIISLSTTL